MYAAFVFVVFASFAWTTKGQAVHSSPPCAALTDSLFGNGNGGQDSVASDSSVYLTATPGVIEKDITTDLEISCQYSGSKPIVAIGIGKKSNGNTKSLVYIVSSQPDIIIKPDAQLQVQTSGLIDDDNQQANISIAWRNPSPDEQGDYVCLVSEMLDLGWVRNRETSVYVRATGVTEQRLLQRLEVLENRLENLGSRLEQQDQAMAAVQEALFSVSTEYQNHTYYLSEYLPVSYSKAEAVCGALGGYLAEIDNMHEYNFLREFLSPRMTVQTIVLIAGTDEGHTNQWVFKRTNHTVGFLDWWTGEPNNIGVEHRLSLMKDREGNGSGIHMNSMYVHSAPGLQNFYQYGFLCEVP